MIILLEGPDGAGKTTLAKIIAARLGVEPYKFNQDVEKQTLFYEYIKPIVESGHEDVVVDRLWPSELIYGRIIRGRVRLTPVEQALLAHAFAVMHGTLVLCLPPQGICKANYEANISKEYVKEGWQWEYLYQRYAEYASDPSLLLGHEHLHCRTLVYDYARHDPKRFMDEQLRLPRRGDDG